MSVEPVADPPERPGDQSERGHQEQRRLGTLQRPIVARRLIGRDLVKLASNRREALLESVLIWTLDRAGSTRTERRWRADVPARALDECLGGAVAGAVDQPTGEHPGTGDVWRRREELDPGRRP